MAYEVSCVRDFCSGRSILSSVWPNIDDGWLMYAAGKISDTWPGSIAAYQSSNFGQSRSDRRVGSKARRDLSQV